MVIPTAIISPNSSSFDTLSDISADNIGSGMDDNNNNNKAKLASNSGTLARNKAAKLGLAKVAPKKRTVTAKKARKLPLPVKKIHQIKIKQQVMTYDIVDGVKPKATKSSSASAPIAPASAAIPSEVITSYTTALMADKPTVSITTISAAATTPQDSLDNRFSFFSQDQASSHTDANEWPEETRERLMTLTTAATSAELTTEAVQESWLRQHLAEQQNATQADSVQSLYARALQHEQQEQQIRQEQASNEVNLAQYWAQLEAAAYMEQQRQQQLAIQQLQQQYALQEQQKQQQQQQLEATYFQTALTAVQSGTTVEQIVYSSGLAQDVAIQIAQYMQLILQTAAASTNM